jgi:hypothetical protein
MDAFVPKRYGAAGPEAKIQEKIVKMLIFRGWFVKRIIGNKYQSGLPDLYATHPDYGGRWIEVKLPGMKGSRFTNAQLELFPNLIRNGTPIYILTGDTEMDYRLLFGPGNADEIIIQEVLNFK